MQILSFTLAIPTSSAGHYNRHREGKSPCDHGSDELQGKHHQKPQQRSTHSSGWTRHSVTHSASSL